MSVKCWPMNRACNDWLMLRNKGHGTCTWCSWTMVRRQLQFIVYYFSHCCGCGCGCGCFACRWHYKHSHEVLSLIFGYVRLCCWCFALRKPIKIHQPQLRSKLWTATVVLRRGNQNWYFCHQKHWKKFHWPTWKKKKKSKCTIRVWWLHGCFDVCFECWPLV